MSRPDVEKTNRLWNFMNNFFGLLPGGYRTLYSDTIMDKLYEGNPYNSDLKKQKTGRMFVADVAAEVDKEGLTADQIKSLRDGEADTETRRKTGRVINALKRKGYNIFDLRQ